MNHIGHRTFFVRVEVFLRKISQVEYERIRYYGDGYRAVATCVREREKQLL